MAGCVCQPPTTLASLFGAAPDLRCEKCAPTARPVGGRGEIARRIDRLCNSVDRDVQRIGAELAKLHYRLDPMNVEHDLDDEISIALIIAKVNALATRPSPAPSGERDESNATPNPNEV